MFKSKGIEYLRIEEYIKNNGSNFLYIMYNGHIGEYDSIKNISVKNMIDKLVITTEDIYKFKIEPWNHTSKQYLTLLKVNDCSKNFFGWTWNKENFKPTRELNYSRYWDKRKPNGTLE